MQHTKVYDNKYQGQQEQDLIPVQHRFDGKRLYYRVANDPRCHYMQEYLEPPTDRVSEDGYQHSLFSLGLIAEALGYLPDAIQEFTNLIQFQSKLYGKCSEYSDAYYHRGRCYEKQGKLAEARGDYLKAFQFDPVCAKQPDVADKIKIILNNISADEINKISKKNLLALIKALPHEEKISLLEQSLDSSTDLGKRFWKQEGFFACRLTAGSLKEIHEDLLKLKPDFVMKTDAVVKTPQPTLFQPVKSPPESVCDRASFGSRFPR